MERFQCGGWLSIKLEEFGDEIWAEFNINYSYIIHTIYTITQNIKTCNVGIFEP